MPCKFTKYSAYERRALGLVIDLPFGTIDMKEFIPIPFFLNSETSMTKKHQVQLKHTWIAHIGSNVLNAPIQKIFR